MAIKAIVSRELIDFGFGSLLHYPFYLASLVSCFVLRLFLIWYLLLGGGLSLSLVAVFVRVAGRHKNLAYQLSIVLRAVFCGSLPVSSSELSILTITGSLATFCLPLTELVRIEILTFKSFRLSSMWPLGRLLRFFFSFHRSHLVEGLRYCIELNWLYCRLSV